MDEVLYHTGLLGNYGRTNRPPLLAMLVTFVSATRARHGFRAARNRISHLCKSTPSTAVNNGCAPRARTHKNCSKIVCVKSSTAPNQCLFFFRVVRRKKNPKKKKITLPKETSRVPHLYTHRSKGTHEREWFARAPCYGVGRSARVGGNNHRRFFEDGAMRLPRRHFFFFLLFYFFPLWQSSISLTTFFKGSALHSPFI